MADGSMCGPSNPLQTFQKQTSADRSLQQDRFTARNGASQNFRSQQRGAGALEQDFQAFQAGFDPRQDPFTSIQDPAPLYGAPLPSQQSFAPQASTPAWASEFSKLSLGSPAPAAIQNPMNVQQHHAANTTSAGWHNDFQRLHMNPATAMPFQPAPLPSQNMGLMSPFTPHAVPQYTTNSMMAKGKDLASAEHDAKLADSFDQEFERFALQAERDANKLVTSPPPLENELEKESNAPIDIRGQEQEMNIRAEITHHVSRVALLSSTMITDVFELLEDEIELGTGFDELISRPPHRIDRSKTRAALRKANAELVSRQRELENLHQQLWEVSGGSAKADLDMIGLQQLNRLKEALVEKDKSALREIYWNKDFSVLEHLTPFDGLEDKLRAEEEESRIQHSKDDEALAETAGEVANNLSRDTKFANSKFLQFMRDLESYDKKVRDNKVVSSRQDRHHHQQDGIDGDGLNTHNATSVPTDADLGRASNDSNKDAYNSSRRTGFPIEDFTYG